VLDAQVYETWSAIDDAGRHGENLRMLRRLLEAQPDDAELHLLLARTLTAMECQEDSLAAVYRAIDCGQDDAGVLTRAASMCFYAADVPMARDCIDRAKKIQPRGFALKKDLKELDRKVSRREKEGEVEERLSEVFDEDPARPGLATEYARLLAKQGRAYAAYHVVARGLHYHPDDRSLRQLEKKLGLVVPDDVRAEAKHWAASGKPATISPSKRSENAGWGPYRL
jgi:Flp pilus assembly protein TadD